MDIAVFCQYRIDIVSTLYRNRKSDIEASLVQSCQENRVIAVTAFIRNTSSATEQTGLQLSIRATLSLVAVAPCSIRNVIAATRSVMEAKVKLHALHFTLKRPNCENIIHVRNNLPVEV